MYHPDSSPDTIPDSLLPSSSHSHSHSHVHPPPPPHSDLSYPSDYSYPAASYDSHGYDGGLSLYPDAPFSAPLNIDSSSFSHSFTAPSYTAEFPGSADAGSGSASASVSSSSSPFSPPLGSVSVPSPSSVSSPSSDSRDLPILERVQSLLPRLSFPFQLYFRQGDRHLAGRQILAPVHITVNQLIQKASQLEHFEAVSIDQHRVKSDTALIEVPIVLKRFLQCAGSLSQAAIAALPDQAPFSRPSILPHSPPHMVSLPTDSRILLDHPFIVTVDVHDSVKACSRLGCMNFLVKRASRRTCDTCQRSGYDVSSDLLVQVSLLPVSCAYSNSLAREVNLLVDISLGRSEFWKFEGVDDNSFILAFAESSAAQLFQSRLRELLKQSAFMGRQIRSSLSAASHSPSIALSTINRAPTPTSSSLIRMHHEPEHSLLSGAKLDRDDSVGDSEEYTSQYTAPPSVGATGSAPKIFSDNSAASTLSKVSAADFSTARFAPLVAKLALKSGYDYMAHFQMFNEPSLSFSIRMKSHFWCLTVSELDPEGRINTVRVHRKIGKPNQRRAPGAKKSDSPKAGYTESSRKSTGKKRRFAEPNETKSGSAWIDSESPAAHLVPLPTAPVLVQVTSGSSSDPNSASQMPSPPLSESLHESDGERDLEHSMSASGSRSSNGFDSQLQLKRESDAVSNSHGSEAPAFGPASPPHLLAHVGGSESQSLNHSDSHSHSRSPFQEFDEKDHAIAVPMVTFEHDFTSAISAPLSAQQLAASNSVILSDRGFQLMQRKAIAATMSIYGPSAESVGLTPDPVAVQSPTPVILVYRSDFQRDFHTSFTQLNASMDEDDNDEGDGTSRSQNSRSGSGNSGANAGGFGGGNGDGGGFKRRKQDDSNDNQPNKDGRGSDTDKHHRSFASFSGLSSDSSFLSSLFHFLTSRLWLISMVLLGLATVALLVINGLQAVSQLSLLVESIDDLSTKANAQALVIATENDIAALRLISTPFHAWARTFDPDGALEESIVAGSPVYARLFGRDADHFLNGGISTIMSSYSLDYLADRCLNSAQVAFGVADWILFANDRRTAFAYRNNGHSIMSRFPTGAADFCAILDNEVGRAYLQQTLCQSIPDQEFIQDPMPLCDSIDDQGEWNRATCEFVISNVLTRNITNDAFLASTVDGSLHRPVYPVSAALDFYQQSQAVTPTCARLRSRSATVEALTPVYRYTVNYPVLAGLLLGSSALLVLFASLLFSVWHYGISPKSPIIPSLSRLWGRRSHSAVAVPALGRLPHQEPSDSGLEMAMQRV